jgi:hypothetical protein
MAYSHATLWAPHATRLSSVGICTADTKSSDLPWHQHNAGQCLFLTLNSLVVALNRAMRDLLQSPDMRHKSRLHLYMSVGIDGEPPIPFWQLFRR